MAQLYVHAKMGRRAAALTHRLESMIARRAVALCLAIAAASAAAAPVRTGHVTAELVAQKTAFVPGADNVVALKLTLDKGWHTYWRNAGDSGLPTTLAWTLPAGISAGPIEWLPPQLLPAGPLTNYGYEGVAWHPVTLHAAPGAALGSGVALAARADWLVCRETCIPEGADLTLALPVATQAVDDPREGAAITAARARVPAPLAAGWSASARGEGQRVALELRPPAGAADPGVLRFFPNDDGRIEPSGAQALARRGDDYVLTLPVAWQLDKGFTRVNGLLAASGAGFGGARAATIDVPLEGAVVAGPKPVDAAAAPLALDVAAPVANDTMTLALAALFAFVGGMILNLMPCVFPVLSLKVLGFATRQDDRATMRREALAFAAGVIVTFVLLAMMLLALRAAGQELGWGFQLQSPVVVTALAVLFFALGLNLAGVFEFGQLAPAAWRGWTSSNRTLDAFGSGVLAVVVASPCTAPFMGAALGFALSQSAASTLAIFVMLGIGMALPYALLAWFPAWRQRLPRPGAWMLRLKQLLAFPDVRHGGLARLGAGRADRQRRRAAALRRAHRDGIRAVGAERAARRRGARIRCRSARRRRGGAGAGGAAGHHHHARRHRRAGECRRRLAAVHAPRRCAISPLRVARCSSISPPRGASPARSTSARRSPVPPCARRSRAPMSRWCAPTGRGAIR